MFKSLRSSGLLLLPAALVAFSSATAQTAPSLLPYTAKLIAGSGTVAIAKGATCPISGFTSVDAYGDGCLAVEVQLGSATTGGPRYAVADKNGNVFFGDFINGLVRRIDVNTGIITAVAGGATASPAVGTACGTGISIDANGDGCPATSVKLSKPAGVVFASNGDLLFSDNGYDNIRRIAATGGLITTTGTITNVAGNVTTYGYNVNNTSLTGPVIAATQSYVNFPYGLTFDAAGNLYIADEGNNAIEVINLTAASETIQGMTVPAGTIAKFAGYGSLAAKTAASGDCPDFVSTSARGGCYFGKWTDGALANVSNNDGVYAVGVDSSNNVYFTNEFNDNIGLITSANVISNYAGIQASVAKQANTKRGVAGSFGTGSSFGLAVDPQNNVYYTDASAGIVWRVDAGTKNMYAVAGGTAVGSVCGNATDTLGDGCPALQANLGSSGTTFASTTLPGPGVYGVSVDAYSDLFLGDTETFVLREIASGTQFGTIGANQPTNILDIHFAVGDGPLSSGAYTVTTGASNFTVAAVATSCVTNSDNTTDCLVPLTATPSVLGLFTGTLTVKSVLGTTAAFPLSGIYIQSPVTRTALTYSAPAGSCAGTTTFSTSTPITLTASLTANGPSNPTGTITFFSNGTQIGTPQTVGNIGTTANPVYGATLVNTFSTVGTYTLTATYSGDTYFKTSTGKSASTVTTASAGFTTAFVTSTTTNPGCVTGTAGQCTVVAGQSALYSFTIAQAVYTGTLSFACSGLPAGAACNFSPATISATGCSTSNIVALTITTTALYPSLSTFGLSGAGRWQMLCILPGLALALMLGLRRRRMRFGNVWMSLALLLVVTGLAGCGNGLKSAVPTPSGTYTITVTATGSTGGTSILQPTLTVK